jgi:hypothetical protein
MSSETAIYVLLLAGEPLSTRAVVLHTASASENECRIA